MVIESEVNTMAREKKIYCPANGWDCPFYKDSECGLEDPMKNCDDFRVFWDADEEFESDEPRTFFEE